MSARSKKARAFSKHDPRQAWFRAVFAIAVGILTALLLPAHFGAPLRAVAGWDATATANLALAWWIIVRADENETRRRASSHDPGRHFVWGLVLVASSFSLFSAAVVLRQARTLAPSQSGLLVCLCLLAVISAWALTHTSYALRYAHLFYRESENDGEGGLTFPGDQCPNDFDLAYFSFTIGMCFQVSDVTVTSRTIRRTVLAHSILSFAYNTVILALALNLVFGLLG